MKAPSAKVHADLDTGTGYMEWANTKIQSKIWDSRKLFAKMV